MTANRTVVRVHSPGGYERLELETEPLLEPGPGEVRVRTRAVGVNYADCAVRWGVYRSARELVGWPIVPGFEFAGEVDAAEPETRSTPSAGGDEPGRDGAAEWTPPRRPRVGDRVFGVRLFGGYASHVTAPAAQVFPLPKGWTDEQAAAFPVAFLTAYHGLFQCVRIREGGTILVHSAAGGVGTALLQLARIRGWRAIGVVGRRHKEAVAREFGAAEVIVREEEDLWAAAHRHAPGGYDAVLDASGPETLAHSFEALAPTGKLVVYGFHTMLPRSSHRGRGRMSWTRAALGWLRTPRFSPLRMTADNRTVAGFNLSFLGDRQDLLDEAMADLLPWIAEGRIQPPATTTYPLDRVGEAHRALESAMTTGKLVLVP
jgi:NADPH:quinone reductase-like Zn-dependent oxidoreductase